MLAPGYQILKINDFFVPKERAIELPHHFTRLEWLEVDNVVFDATADLLNLMSQLVNLKILYILDIKIRSSTRKTPIGPILYDHVDAVPKRLRNLKLQDPTTSLYVLLAFRRGLCSQ